MFHQILAGRTAQIWLKVYWLNSVKTLETTLKPNIKAAISLKRELTGETFPWKYQEFEM